MTRVLMVFPIVSVVVQLVRVPAIFVCADVRTKIVDEMSSGNCISSMALVSASPGYSLLPCLCCEKSLRAKCVAVRALEKIFIRLR